MRQKFGLWSWRLIIAVKTVSRATHEKQLLSACVCVGPVLFTFSHKSQKLGIWSCELHNSKQHSRDPLTPTLTHYKMPDSHTWICDYSRCVSSALRGTSVCCAACFQPSDCSLCVRAEDRIYQWGAELCVKTGLQYGRPQWGWLSVV